jgi:putative transposase
MDQIALNEIVQNNPTCKYCHSSHVIKYGTSKGTQVYLCRDCNHKFLRTDTIPKMHNTTKDIAGALNMYYEGMSLNEIRRHFIQQDNNYISKISAHYWVQRFSDLAIKEAEKYQPKVGDTWIADETLICIDKRKLQASEISNPCDKNRSVKWLIFWNIIDANTHFLLASHVTTSRSKKDAELLIKKATQRAGKLPKVLVTDKLGSYLDEVALSYNTDTKHNQDKNFTIEHDAGFIEYFHNTLEDKIKVMIILKNKVMRGLNNKDTRQKVILGWLVHYNFFRPHISLDDKTPAESAGIVFPFRNWQDIVEQPYEKTSRIQIKTENLN